MKIAAITITYNDDYKLKEWYDHYLEYGSQVYMNIIVDNGSDEIYLKQVKRLFSDSIIVERTKNGGTTAAYNDGIRIALADPNVDSILLIGNDMRIDNNGIKVLHDFLYSDFLYGMVAPVILEKNSFKIESLGCFVAWNLYLKEYFIGNSIADIEEDTFIVETVAGGMNLAKREFYEDLGLQDEDLFMYSDEADLGLRIMKSKYKAAVTKKSLAWHEHINPNKRNIRLPYSAFLIGRNKIYLGYKHFGFMRAFIIFCFHLYSFTKGLLLKIGSKQQRQYQLYFLFGSFCGILRIKRNFNFIVKN